MSNGTAFQYEIVEHIATLSESNGTTKELNRISYNGAPPKLDLRSWKQEGTEKRMLKGLTLTDAEAAALKDALDNLSREPEKKERLR